MRAESAFFSGMAGLLSHGTGLSVVGDNVANFSTVGFKKQRAEFESLVSDFSSKFSTSSGGDGGKIARVRNLFMDGTIEMTSRELDFAVQGSGFFVVTDGVNRYFTRAGNFSVDGDGFLVTNSGLRVLGFVGQNFDQLAPINVRAPQLPPQPSTQGSLVLNLDASAVVSGFPPNPASFADIASVSTFSTTISVVNSLGAKKNISLYFAKTGVNQWEVRAYVDGSEVGQAPGQPIMVGQSVLQFSPEGLLIGNTQINLNINWQGANPQNFTINLAGSTQFASPSNVKLYQADGQGVRGEPTQLLAQKNGLLSLLFADGSTYNIGYFSLGRPGSYEDLLRVSENLFFPSGPYEIINPAQGQSSGSFMNGALERSNVDITEEFLNMIVLQKGFSANSKVVNTTQEILDVALALKR